MWVEFFEKYRGTCQCGIGPDYKVIRCPMCEVSDALYKEAKK
jgi:hypothetical protein